MASFMFRELPDTLRLAVPLIIGQVTQMLMGWADTLMVARVGLDALAACAFANNVFSVVFVVGIGVLSSITVVCSQAFGALRHSEIGSHLQAGLLLSLLMAVPGTLLFLFSPLWAPVLKQPPGVIEDAATYLVPLAWSLIPGLFIMGLKGFSEALSRPWVPFWVLIVSVGLNVVLNWLLIFGNLGFPAMGLEGAGWATLISRVAAAVALFWWIATHASYRFFLPSSWWIPGVWKRVLNLLKVGMPVGGQFGAEVGAFALAGLMMGWIGEAAMAAHQIALTCAATTFMFPLGLSMALTVRIGQAKGAGEQERLRPLYHGGLLLSLVSMTLFAVIFLTCGKWIAALFVESPEVIELTAALLIVAGIFQVADGVQVSTVGALRGLGDVRWPMWVAIGSYWVVALPLGAWLAFGAGLSAVGVWLGLALGLFFAAALLWRRFEVSAGSRA